MLPRASAVGFWHLIIALATAGPCAALVVTVLPVLTGAVLPGAMIVQGAALPCVAAPIARLPGASATGWRSGCGH